MQVLIIGAGDIGLQLAKRLSIEKKYDIAIVESDPHNVKRAIEQLDALVVEGHGASYQSLKDANVHEADIVAAMTNIHPERETADAIVRLIRQSSATDLIEFESGRVQLLGIRLEENSSLLDIPLIELGEKSGDPPLRIVAIVRKQMTLIPKGHDALEPGDQIFVICDPGYTKEFIALTGKKDTRIDDIMILGGGLIGQFTASTLAKDTNVKIIESNAEKSEEIAEVLPHTLIIHGDGTDYDLLAAEGIVDMDAFIAVTGDDETNIISTLLARHMKIPRTIALVNKVDYLPITNTIGMDAVVSKQLLTVNAVLRHIQHQQVAAIASLPGIDAQCIEYIAKAGSKITKKKLRDVQFPPDAIVGAILKEDDLTVPKGETQVSAGDKVVVFTLPHALDSVEKLFK
jgi:trk system potassium uptake protein TrkA